MYVDNFLYSMLLWKCTVFLIERRVALYERPVKVITTLCFVFNYKTNGKVVKKTRNCSPSLFFMIDLLFLTSNIF